MMETFKDFIGIVQDNSAMYSSLLMIMEALETGVMPKSFLVYNDNAIDEAMDRISQLLHDKAGVEIQD
ncbi:MAG: hypothetical protein MSS96_02870 [Bacteroidales bacterium]|nr:hypothetical protein [Bacteroidales bacterium]